MGHLKICDKRDFSPSGRKLERSDPTGIATWDQNKLKQVNRAQRKTFLEYRQKSIVEDQEVRSRDKVRKVLKQFKELYTQLLEEWESERIKERKGGYRADLKATSILRAKGTWINCYPYIGHVPGVQIGDRFQYRVELAIIGLHREYICGIHCERIHGKSYATSIVDSGRYYHNETVTTDEFIYIGEGGNPEVSSALEDQTLYGGNLALKNSMESEIPVRVIRGDDSPGPSNTMGINKRSGFTFVYDGLYQVTACDYCISPKTGKHVFKFTMKGIIDDPNLTQATYLVPRISRMQKNQGMINDMGHQKENIIRKNQGMINNVGCQKGKTLGSAVKNVKTSKFIYNSKPNCCGGTRWYFSRLRNRDEDGTFDHAVGAVAAKPVISNRQPYPKCAKPKLKLS